MVPGSTGSEEPSTSPVPRRSVHVTNTAVPKFDGTVCAASTGVQCDRKIQADMEYLRWACRQQYVSEFGGGKGGTCPRCGIYAIGDLGRHIMDHHLKLNQLWRYPVEWCTVWKGSVWDCMDHLCSKHNGIRFLGLYPG